MILKDRVSAFYSVNEQKSDVYSYKTSVTPQIILLIYYRVSTKYTEVYKVN